ncbi:MAG: zonular occludens toxin domain-containing protein [Wolinella sp.]
MIYFITGVPGGGKSAFGVNLIYEAFINEKSSHYGSFDFCYTNISGFKVEDERLNGKVDWLNFDILLEFAKLDYNLLQLNKHIRDYDGAILSLLDSIEQGIAPQNSIFTLPSDFEYSFEKLKGHKFKKVLFIIDECHNFLDKKNQVLIRWLTYHRHFYQDICLITQDLALVDSSYKTQNITDSYYKAFNPRFRLFKNQLRYERNASPKFYKKSKLEIVTIKADPKIFELYTSGENRVVTPYYVRLIIIGVILAILIVFILNNLFNTKEGENPPLQTSSSPATDEIPLAPPPQSQSDDISEPVCFICSKISCSLRTRTVPIELITKYLKNKTLEPISSYQSDSFSRFCFLAPSGFFKNAPPSKDLGIPSFGSSLPDFF